MADTGQIVHWSLVDTTTGQTVRSGPLLLCPDFDLYADLEDVIEEFDLQEAIRGAFPPTSPLWFGLCMSSPLSRSQCMALHRLLAALAREWRGYRPILKDLLPALERAGSEGYVLDVRMTAPGHTDCGWDTTFAHCPRCKAEAPLPRWKEYPEEEISCPICSYRYSPAETSSSTPWPEAPAPNPAPKRRRHGVPALLMLPIALPYIFGLLTWLVLKELVADYRHQAAQARRERRRRRRLLKRGSA